MIFKKSCLYVIPLGIFLTFSAHAQDKTKTKTIDCARDSLQAELDKLDKSIANVLEFTGNCQGLITIEGHRDLTLVGIEPASISGVYVPGDSGASTTALDIFDSRVSLQGITFNGGNYGVWCSDKSTCILRDVTTQSGHVGVGVQSQSTVDILGASQIINSEQWGVGVFGGSSVNMGPSWDLGFDPFEAGPVVSGHNVGIWVQDQSFFRSDNVTVTGNVNGVQAQRDALIKMFVAYDFANDQWAVPGAGVIGNTGYGFQIHRNSTAQIGLPVTNNGGSGIRLGSLSFLQNAGLFFDQNAGGDVSCEHPTAVSNFCTDLSQTLSDLQAQIAALEGAANETLEQKVAGKTFAFRTSGHGSGGTNNAPQASPPLFLGNPQRDFSLADGTLTLAEDGSYNLQLLLTIIPMNVSGFYQEINDIPIGNSGTWEVDGSTNEIVLTNVSTDNEGNEVVSQQRLQSTPSGEVLTVVSNDQRLVKGDTSVGGFFNTYYADSVYIQLPDFQ